MAEKIKYSPEGWTFYGSDFGGKVDGLLEFEKEKLEGIEVTPGIAIGASYFREFIRKNQFGEQHWPDDVIQDGVIPDKLKEANIQILAKFSPGICIAVRSSVIGEDGGVGIYSTHFMVTTDNSETDLIKLWSLQSKVYADYFSYQSRDWLDSKGLEFQDSGVGLLVQPVVGDQVDEVFMPTISGVVTTINNELMIRLVLGLGTKAVDMKDAIALSRENINVETAGEALYGLLQAEGVPIPEGGILINDLSVRWRDKILDEVGKLHQLIALSKEFLKRGMPYYLEFAVTPSMKCVQILQANPDKIKTTRSIELGPVAGKVLCESDDIVNWGSIQGRGIIYPSLRGVNPNDLWMLEDFNRSNKGYLLIVDDLLLSRLGRNGLQYNHFSNAAGVVEIQTIRQETANFLGIRVNHSDRGGTHFAEICKRSDILFQGVSVRHWDKSLVNALGPFTESLGRYGGYFDLGFKMANSGSVGRTEIFGEVIKPDYSREDFQEWITELRFVADILLETGTPGSDALYTVSGHMVFALGRSVADYQPLSFVDQLSSQSLEEMIAGLEIVQKNLYLTESYSAYQEGIKYGVSEEEGNVFELREYLLKLQSRVKERLAML